MVGTIVTDDGETFQPTAQILMLGHVEIAGHTLHQVEVVHIIVELGKGAERSHFKGFPRRGKFGRIVFPEMLQNELVTAAAQLCT